MDRPQEPNPNDRSPGTKRSTAVFIICLLGILLSLQELLLRFVFPVPEILNFRRLAYSQPARSGQRLPSIAHQTLWWWSEPDGAQFARQTNLYEFHDHEWLTKKSSLKPRVAFIGDSFIEGLGAPSEAAIPTVFERSAATIGLNLETMNLGAAGFGLGEYLLLARDIAPLYKPDHLILAVYMNDAYDIPTTKDLSEKPLAPKYANLWQPRFLYVLQKRQQDQRAPRRWHDHPGSEPSPLIVESRFQADQHLVKNIERYVQPRLAESMRKGSLNPAITNLLLRSERFLPQTLDFTGFVQAISNFMANRKIHLWIVYIPSLNQVSDAYLGYQAQLSAPISAESLTGKRFQQHARDLAHACQVAGVPYLDLTPILRDVEAKNIRLYWAYDGHMNSTGYATTAGAIFDWWKAKI